MKIAPFGVGAINTNAYLVWDEETKEAMLIDPGDHDRRLDNEIRDKGLNLKYIVLTHGHCDHICGVPEYKEMFPDVKVVAGKSELEILKDSSKNQAMQFFGIDTSITPDILLEDSDTFNLGSLEFRVIETPGHSPGGISIYTENIDNDVWEDTYHGSLFSGDTLFRQSLGRSDLYGGDMTTLLKSIREKLYSLPDDTVVYPGHMGYTTIGFEKVNNPFVNGH